MVQEAMAQVQRSLRLLQISACALIAFCAFQAFGWRVVEFDAVSLQGRLSQGGLITEGTAGGPT